MCACVLYGHVSLSVLHICEYSVCQSKIAASEPRGTSCFKTKLIRFRWPIDAFSIESCKLGTGDRGGGDIDPVLSNSSVVLLNAEWVVETAKAGGVLMPRQAMPSEAYLSLSEVQVATGTDRYTGEGHLHVICISHCWLQPSHPDPKGHNIGVVAHAAEIFLKDWGGHWAIFLDFSSILQCCRDASGEPQARTYRWLDEQSCFDEGAVGRYSAEDALFKEALGSLGAFYSHPSTFVFMLSAFPPDYDDPERYSKSGNVKPYMDRGWCFCEAS